MSRIWDVDGIEWEDLPTVSDLLCAADTKILAPEVALRYGGKPDDRGRVDNERDLKRARRKIKKLRKIDPEPSDKIVLLPKHVINRRNADHGFGYYDVEPCAFTRGGAQKLGEDACAEVYPWTCSCSTRSPQASFWAIAYGSAANGTYANVIAFWLWCAPARCIASASKRSCASVSRRTMQPVTWTRMRRSKVSATTCCIPRK